MRAKQCLDVLLDSEQPIEKKAKCLCGFITWHDALSRNMHMSAEIGRSMAMAELRECLPQDDSAARAELDTAIREVAAFQQDRARQRSARATANATRLYALRPGTAIVIQNESRQDVVRLVEMKRTRLMGEYPDGQRFSIPVSHFIRVHEGSPPSWLSEEQRQQRDLVRALAGPQFMFVTRGILASPENLVPAMLDELAAASDRIRNAPIGMSGGVLFAGLKVRKVDPSDHRLVKRISQIARECLRIGEPANRRTLMENHSSHDVRDLLQSSRG